MVFADHTVHGSSEQLACLTRAIRQSQDYFLQTQRSAGYWVFDLENDSTIVADYIYLMHYIGHIDLERQQKAVNQILSVQQPDGGWNIYHGGPSDLNATIKCGFALQLAGYNHSFPPLQRAGECIRRLGGLQKMHSYNRFYLGLFGQFPWQRVVAIRTMFLPSFYFNI